MTSAATSGYVLVCEKYWTIGDMVMCVFFFFQAEDGIRDLVRSRGLGDVYKRQSLEGSINGPLTVSRRAASAPQTLLTGAPAGNSGSRPA